MTEATGIVSIKYLTTEIVTTTSYDNIDYSKIQSRQNTNNLPSMGGGGFCHYQHAPGDTQVDQQESMRLGGMLNLEKTEKTVLYVRVKI